MHQPDHWGINELARRAPRAAAAAGRERKKEIGPRGANSMHGGAAAAPKAGSYFFAFGTRPIR